MSHIKVLHKVVADQIAAGEVVERPASVVKELVENSLDAGATNVLLEIEGGGAGRIRVMDNGAGFDNDDIELAFLRHSTSKISNIEDLNTVSSFGFRGEALASIASVAKVTVHTRIKDAVAGTRLRIEGGQIVDKREAASPVGTEFDVQDLFFNVPARLKFLKKQSTEASHCIEALVRLALVRPNVSFKVVSSGRTVRELVRVTDPIERVRDLFSSETLALTEDEENGISVRAILGAPEKARAGAGSLYTYVNGRYVRDRAMLRAVTQAFGRTLESGRYPVGFISVDVPPGSFDVNVHPQKTEVRFANPQAVFRAVSHVVGAMAAKSPWAHYMVAAVDDSVEQMSMSITPEASEDSEEVDSDRIREAKASYDSSQPKSFPNPPTHGFSTQPSPLSKSIESGGFPSHSKEEISTHAACAAQSVVIPKSVEQVQESISLGQSAQKFSQLRYIGQAKSMFLIMEDAQELVIIDQHAAHERVTYERLRQELAAGKIASQRLLQPHMIDLGPAETSRIVDHKEALERLGLEVEQAGTDRIAIYGVPAEISASPDRLLAEMVLALEEEREGTRGETEDHAVATMACHSSIRAGRKVLDQEVDALLLQMDEIDFAGHCPHGRPVLARIPWSEIRRRVKRE